MHKSASEVLAFISDTVSMLERQTGFKSASFPRSRMLAGINAQAVHPKTRSLDASIFVQNMA